LAGESWALHHAMNHVRFMIGPELDEVRDRMQGESLHHAMNHVRFMIGPELDEVQDRMQGGTLNLRRFRGEGEYGQCRDCRSSMGR
jgi:cytochrome c2